ncbi:Protein Y39B6A.33 [Aphelenchoides avenae]|nr:Protein Y39B6A.33 [Aphelenchus avenae]
MGKGVKKGWKKLPRDVDEAIHDVHRIKETAAKEDDELFFTDVTKQENVEEEKPKLTHRQSALAAHIERRTKAKEALKRRKEQAKEHVSFKEACNAWEQHVYKPVLASQRGTTAAKLQRIGKLKRRTSPAKAPATKSPAEKSYDLWEQDPEKKTLELYEKHEDPVIVEHYLKQTRKVKPKAPKTTKHVPSVLPAVEVAKEGASYNPSLESYLDYANGLAKDEAKMEKEEHKATKRMKLAAGERYVTEAELEANEKQGFWFAGDDEGAPEEEEEPAEEKPEEKTDASQTKPKAKTMKQRKKELQLKVREMEKSKEKLTKKQEQELLRLKSLLKEITKEERDHRESVEARRTKRTLRKLTSRKHLGRGRYEAYEEPVLLTDELTGSLRTLKPQGDLFEERVKSLQKRNILPIGGEREQRRKKSLKSKLVERRDVKEVTKGSRVF